jgi:hypothetical protein
MWMMLGTVAVIYPSEQCPMTHKWRSQLVTGKPVQKHFDFVDSIFAQADDHLKNAVYVSYLENVVLSQILHHC